MSSHSPVFSSGRESNQVTGGILISSSFQKISVLLLDSQTYLSSDLPSSNVSWQTNLSISQPMISNIISSNGDFTISPQSLPLYQVCEYCTNSSHPMVSKGAIAHLVFNSCPHINSSLLSCYNSIHPSLFDCCLKEFKSIPILFLPPGSLDVSAHPSTWKYLSDERIDQHWTAIEKICREMKSVPGCLQLIIPSFQCRYET